MQNVKTGFCVAAMLARGRPVLTIYGWTNPPLLILGRGVTLPPGH